MQPFDRIRYTYVTNAGHRRQDAAVKFDPSIPSVPFVCGNRDEARRGEATEHQTRDPAHHSLSDKGPDLDRTGTRCSIYREERPAGSLTTNGRKRGGARSNSTSTVLSRLAAAHGPLFQYQLLRWSLRQGDSEANTTLVQLGGFPIQLKRKFKPANQGLSVIRHSTDPSPVPTGEQAAGIPPSQDFRKNLVQVLEGRGKFRRT